MNFVRKSFNSLVNLQQIFRIAEIELGVENTIGITLETCVGVQSAILHICRLRFLLGSGHVGRVVQAQETAQEGQPQVLTLLLEQWRVGSSCFLRRPEKNHYR